MRNLVRSWHAVVGTAAALSVLVMPPVLSPQAAVAKAVVATSCPVVEENIDGKTFSVARLVVKGRPEQVWQLLTDYNNAARVFPLLKKCVVLEDKGSTKIMRHVVAPSGFCGTFEYVLEVKESAPRQLEWHRVSGAFKEVDGFWKLEPLDGGRSTMVTYQTHVNGGFFVPQPLIKRQFKVDMPAVLISLKNQIEGSQTTIADRPGQSRDQ